MLEIRTCGDCKHYGGQSEEDGVDYSYCYLERRAFAGNEDVDIPEWCKLKDYPEE
jgi:hypothetical protein